MNLFRAVLAPSSHVTQIRSIDVAVLLGFKIITRLLSPELGFKTITPFFHQEVLTKVRVEVSGGTCSKKSTVEFGLTVLLGKWVFVLFLVMLNQPHHHFFLWCGYYRRE